MSQPTRTNWWGRSTRAARALAAIALGAASWAVPALAETRPAEAAPPAIGEVAPMFTFKDLRYLERSIDDLGAKEAYVFIFTTLDCPVVQRYLPRLKELDEAYRGRGVQLVAMNVGPGDSIQENAHQALKHELAFPFCKDPTGNVARALGATRTPEVVVLDGEKRIRYRGRIDSQYRTGGVQPTAGREDLREALEDILADREVKVAETPVDGCRITFEPPPESAAPVTYAQHVAPVLIKHCTACHHTGSTAPFSLLSYDDAADHAEMIAEVVGEGRMPPSYASEEQAHEIVNRQVLSADERKTVLAWCLGDRTPGDLSQAPPVPEYPDTEWVIGQPDLIVAMPKAVKLPAQGIIPYKYVFLTHKFTEDTWVEGVQILPSNKAAMHHCNLACIPPGAKGPKDALFLTGYVPGGAPFTTNPGEGYIIPKGSNLVLQCHYVTTGQPCEDRTEVGFRFCRGRITKSVKHFRVTTGNFAIAPHDGHYPVTATRTLTEPSTGIGMFSHMHLRGKDMVFKALYPDGTAETLLAIPNYNFDWQMAYRWSPGQKHFPAGTKIEVTAHYDNSAFNPYNPDPSATVREGDQTFEEMMFGFFFFTEDTEQLDIVVDPSTGHARPTQGESDTQASAGGE